VEHPDKFFTGITVIELAGVLAGPGAGYFFAELGAKVIKIENPLTHGDVTRSWKLKSEDPKDPASAYFWSVNALKEFIQLDLTKKAHLDELYRIVSTADIVIANYKAGDDVKLGVDYDSLSRINPKIIYASINGFGQTSSRPAYDLILQAESGFMQMNGEDDGRPLKMPVALIDLLAGHQLKEAILIALLKKNMNGTGSHVTVSLFDSAVASLANQATNWLIAHHLPAPSGSLHPNIAPYGEIYEAKDKQLVTFAIGSNRQFRALCAILGTTNLCSDPHFATNQLRVSNRKELYSLLYDRVKKLTFDELFRACSGKDVPIGKIRNLKEVFSLPEAQAMVRKINHNGKDVTTVSSVAFRFAK
jgi:crotonobetainyl-CoA:carnitine CoA-transferase CaiB-like acyl-CoA transferase